MREHSKRIPMTNGKELDSRWKNKKKKLSLLLMILKIPRSPFKSIFGDIFSTKYWRNSYTHYVDRILRTFFYLPSLSFISFLHSPSPFLVNVVYEVPLRWLSLLCQQKFNQDFSLVTTFRVILTNEHKYFSNIYN